MPQNTHNVMIKIMPISWKTAACKACPDAKAAFSFWVSQIRTPTRTPGPKMTTDAWAIAAMRHSSLEGLAAILFSVYLVTLLYLFGVGLSGLCPSSQ